MRKFAPYKQGIFKPAHPEKYKGGHPIMFRSSLELRFMRYCDNNSAVINWGSESVVVIYKDPTRNMTPHRYFIDFNMLMKDKNGKLHKFWVEIKPKAQTVAPTRGKKADKRYMVEVYTFARNQAKWVTANKEAERKNAKFVILTEQNLKGV